MKKVIIIFVLLLILLVFLVAYPVNKNEEYDRRIISELTSNYELKDDIKYYNNSGNYHIIKTDTTVIVLDNKYQEVYKIGTSEISDNPENYDLVYKNNNLMYQAKKVNKNTIDYKYYDIITYDLLKEVTIGG